MQVPGVRGDLGVHIGGWVSVVREIDGQQVRALAKTRRRDGRRVITHLILMADRVNSPVTSRFPIGWLEGMVNAADVPGLDDDDQLGEEVLTAAIEEVERAGLIDYSKMPNQARPRLKRPDGTDPDGFSRLVAEAYQDALAGGRPIAPTLAAEAGVPVRTVHRWITEARRRGHLAPGRRGPSS